MYQFTVYLLHIPTTLIWISVILEMPTHTHLSKAFHVQFSACTLIHTVICRTTDSIYGPLTKLTVNKLCQLASKPEKKWLL